MSNAAKRFTASVDEEMVRLFGPEALARWNAISAPEVPGGDDLDEVVDEAATGVAPSTEDGS